jgi:AP-1 complex subunit beta-1
LKKPNENQEIVQQVLQTATTDCENPDIRDRAYVYWRLLSTDPQAAKTVVLSDKPPIEDEDTGVSPALLDDLIYHIGSLASVYHKPPEAFIGGKRYGADNVQKAAAEHAEEEDINAPPPQIQAAIKSNDIGNLLDLDWDEPVATGSPTASSKPSAQDDLQDLFSSGSAQPQQTSPTPKAAKSNVNDIMDLFGSAPAPQAAPQSPAFQQSFFQQPAQPAQPPQPQQQHDMFGGDLLFDSQPAAQPNPAQQQKQKQAEKDPFADLF